MLTGGVLGAAFILLVPRYLQHRVLRCWLILSISHVALLIAWVMSFSVRFTFELWPFHVVLTQISVSLAMTAIGTCIWALAYFSPSELARRRPMGLDKDVCLRRIYDI